MVKVCDFLEILNVLILTLLLSHTQYNDAEHSIHSILIAYFQTNKDIEEAAWPSG